jgi:hypothetical protein
MKQIFVFQPFGAEFDSVLHVIKAAGQAVGADVHRLDEVLEAGSITERAYEAIERSDLIVCDITSTNSNVMYRLGYAHAIRKPIVLIAQQRPEQARMPFDLLSVRTLYYELGAISDFRQRLEPVLREALHDPEPFRTRPVTVKSRSTVFVSYSHMDSAFLMRLQVHLKPLEREGLLEAWDDTKLSAGDQWRPGIQEALSRAGAAVLLVTADFLASDFIVTNELPQLLVKARDEGTRIIPVVLKPCRFQRDETLKNFQSINDPSTPMVMLSEGEQERIYDKISLLVEQSLSKAVNGHCLTHS